MEISIPKSEWDDHLKKLLSAHDLFAPVKTQSHLDYKQIDEPLIKEIVYNEAKPVSPLKTFFLPVKENVTDGKFSNRPTLILGAPACDVSALALLDVIYMDDDYTDPSYSVRRENTTVISMDCHSIQDHCHCTSYGIEPGGSKGADASLAVAGDQVILRTNSQKGAHLVELMGIREKESPSREVLETLEEKMKLVHEQLKEQNSALPDYESTGALIAGAPEEVWTRFASSCVSCGACSAICPTCSCFLLIDRPGFEKIRQLDTCQHPGFERVAGGEDPLRELAVRFRNRYMCKYVWRPEQHSLKACTGCGRCTDTCIGQIDKNELIMSLSN